MEKENHDYLLKFIIIGNTNTGKSCLLHFFLENRLWDTAGQERFRSVARTYYRGALGALVLYDITKKDSFIALQQWIKDARELARSDISIIVVGNKLDLTEEREVDNIEAAAFCQENGVQFLETSALNGTNVNESFNALAKNILSKIESGLIDASDIKPKVMNRIQHSNENKAKQSGCSYCSKS